MLFQGQVVNKVPNARATGNPNALQLMLGEFGVSEIMGRYSALAQSGLLFTARCALQATSLVGAAMVGLQLWNRNSAVNLHLLKLGGNIVATSATQTGLALAFGTGQVNAPTGQTAASSVINNLIGGAAPSALALAAGTFVNAPVAQIDLLHNTAAIAGTGEDPGFYLDLEGSIVIAPNTYAAIASLGAAAAAASNNLWAMWAELPV